MAITPACSIGMAGGGPVANFTDDGRESLAAEHAQRCCECTFLIAAGEPIVMDKWGWVHPLCTVGDDAA